MLDVHYAIARIALLPRLGHYADAERLSYRYLVSAVCIGHAFCLSLLRPFDLLVNKSDCMCIQRQRVIPVDQADHSLI